MDLEGNSAELPSFGWGAALTEKCPCISTAFRRIAAFCIAFVRPFPGGISRASSRAATALMFSSLANDDLFGFIGANEHLTELMARVRRGGDYH
jgi:hypothetical protein